MKQTKIQEINVKEIVAEIKNNAILIKKNNSFNLISVLSAFYGIFFKVFRQVFIKNYKKTIDVRDLLALNGSSFVKEVYLNVLNRECDYLGYINNLNYLESDKKFAKILIIARILLSQEGYQHKVKVKGLFFRIVVSFFLKIPVIGYILELFYYHFRLPVIIERIKADQAKILSEFYEAKDPDNNLSFELKKAVKKLTNDRF